MLEVKASSLATSMNFDPRLSMHIILSIDQLTTNCILEDGLDHEAHKYSEVVYMVCS